jgi:hypothetical protein
VRPFVSSSASLAREFCPKCQDAIQDPRLALGLDERSQALHDGVPVQLLPSAAGNAREIGSILKTIRKRLQDHEILSGTDAQRDPGLELG